PVEGHPLHGIECRPAGDFLVTGFVGAPLRFVDRRRGALLLDAQGDRPGRGRACAEVEECGLLGHVSPLFRHGRQGVSSRAAERRPHARYATANPTWATNIMRY